MCVARSILGLRFGVVDMTDFKNGVVDISGVLASLHWPVLIKYSDYEELGFVADASRWEAEVGADGVHLNTSDVLIDASGASYSVEQGANLRVLAPNQSAIDISEVVTWVRAHASMQGHCCVAKLHASSMEEVFAILQSLDD